ncbi:MAG: glutamine synthetase type III, partial [Clostridia bacterium]|nr:glutamine synthetase type III [Clostridia bacterium]
NRTSPFAFTGNKFEFRMLGSSASAASANVVLNTGVAAVLGSFADQLEAADDFKAALHDLIRDTIREHKRILFNGNGYDDAWLAEAAKRGLSNYRTTPEALAHYLDEKNVELFVNNKVFSRTELIARREINEEAYSKVVNIEALTMIDMVKGAILPAVSAYKKTLADTCSAMQGAMPEGDITYEQETLASLAKLSGAAYRQLRALEDAVYAPDKPAEAAALADYSVNTLIPAMSALRITVDEMESIMPKTTWPYPSYGDLLFSVR